MGPVGIGPYLLLPQWLAPKEDVPACPKFFIVVDLGGIRRMPTAKEYAAKRMREFGEELLTDYEMLLAKQLNKVKEDPATGR